MMNDNLLKHRFLQNMSRITELVKLIHTDFDPVRLPGLFQESQGVRADILRTIVVFLHATFEDVLRSFIPKPNKRYSFYSKIDIEKALKRGKIAPEPFGFLYPALSQMAKRRKRIVHDADLLNRTDLVPTPWTFADDWQLTQWLMAVPAFYYQLLISLRIAKKTEIVKFDELRKAMMNHVEFANHLITFSNAQPAIFSEVLEKSITILDKITLLLGSKKIIQPS